MDEITDDTIQQLCTGSQVFFCCLGTTRKAAGSAVSWDSPLHNCTQEKLIIYYNYSVQCNSVILLDLL